MLNASSQPFCSGILHKSKQPLWVERWRETGFERNLGRILQIAPSLVATHNDLILMRISIKLNNTNNNQS